MKLHNIKSYKPQKSEYKYIQISRCGNYISALTNGWVYNVNYINALTSDGDFLKIILNSTNISGDAKVFYEIVGEIKHYIMNREVK